MKISNVQYILMDIVHLLSFLPSVVCQGVRYEGLSVDSSLKMEFTYVREPVRVWLSLNKHVNLSDQPSLSLILHKSSDWWLIRTNIENYNIPQYLHAWTRDISKYYILSMNHSPLTTLSEQVSRLEERRWLFW